jgi:hypothetical protein
MAPGDEPRFSLHPYAGLDGKPVLEIGTIGKGCVRLSSKGVTYRRSGPGDFSTQEAEEGGGRGEDVQAEEEEEVTRLCDACGKPLSSWSSCGQCLQRIYCGESS